MTPPIPLTRSQALRMLEANHEQLKRLGVEKIALYGSVARNEATAESDVDVLVELAEEKLTLEGIHGPVLLLGGALWAARGRHNFPQPQAALERLCTGRCGVS